MIRFYVQCFDRPAFQDDICQEGHIEDFDRAIEDTIIALNTGVLRTRDGNIIKQSEGKAFVQNTQWREKLYNVVDILVAIRRRLKVAERDHLYSFHCPNGYDGIYCFYDRDLVQWFNSSREDIIKIMSSICREIGIHELRSPRRRHYW